MTTNKPEEAMTDRGLLELAAKAAGYSGKRVTAYGVVIMEAGYDAEPLYWNPLEDDGDALRLAVRLGFRVSVYTDRGDDCVFVDSNKLDSMCFIVSEGLSPDSFAATRRAIVRGAAEIGRTKP